MVLKIREYDSAKKMSEMLESEIAETKSTLGKYLRRIDDIRALAEKSRKIREVVMRLSTAQNFSETARETTVGSLSVVLDANISHELSATEFAVQSHQEHLLVLQKARDALKWLDQFDDTDGIKFQVIENEGIPERILFQISQTQTSKPAAAKKAAPKT